MNDDSQNENQKVKEEKETMASEESFMGENDPMENSMEGSGIEEKSSAENCVPDFDISPESGPAKFEEGKEWTEVKDEEEERQRALAREKWLTVTGRKPQNFPTVKRYLKEELESTRMIFFGERRPAQIEKERKQKWIRMITDEAYKKTGPNHGVLLLERGLPYSMEALWCLRFHPNFNCLCTGFRNGGVQVRDPMTCDVVLTLKTLETVDRLPVRALRFYAPDPSKLYIGGASGCVQVFELDTGTQLGAGSSISQINNMDFNLDSTVLATGGRGGIVSTIDPSNLKVTSMKVRPEVSNAAEPLMNDEFHRLRVYSVKFHPNEPNIFLTGGWDRVVKIWDVRVPGSIRYINGPFLCGDALDINENTILTGSWSCENSIQLWDFLSGQLMDTVSIQGKTNRFDGEFIYTAQFYKDGSQLPSNPRLVAVGGGGFDEINVIRIPTGKVLASFPAYKTVSCLDTHGPYVAYGGKESLLRLGKVLLPKKY